MSLKSISGDKGLPIERDLFFPGMLPFEGLIKSFILIIRFESSFSSLFELLSYTESPSSSNRFFGPY
jgi:hypothetical protein